MVEINFLFTYTHVEKVRIYSTVRRLLFHIMKQFCAIWLHCILIMSAHGISIINLLSFIPQYVNRLKGWSTNNLKKGNNTLL